MGIFDNAQTIMINNKEVQSLKIGNNILYQKSSGGQESNILFEDACSSNANLSKYSSPVSVYQSSIGGSPSLTYSSSDNCYVFTNNSSNDWLIYEISDLAGKSNFTFSCECHVSTSSGPYVGLAVMPPTSSLSNTYANLFYIYRYNSSQIYYYAQNRRRTNKSSNVTNGRVTQSPTAWTKIKVVFNSSTGYTVTWEKTDGTVLKTYTGTVSTTNASDRHYGIMLKDNTTSYKAYIRNIKAEKN